MIDRLADSDLVMRNDPMMAAMERMRVQAGSDVMAPLKNGVVTPSLSTPSFGSMLDNLLNQVDNQQHLASEKQRAVDMGLSDDLTGAVLESQKASVAFSALIQVRNKLVAAFDETMNISM